MNCNAGQITLLIFLFSGAPFNNRSGMIVELCCFVAGNVSNLTGRRNG